jgi:hypothetical protein
LSAADKPLRWAHAHTCNSRHHYPVVGPTAHAESATFYGRDGSYQGSAFTYGNQRTFTNNRGEFTGSSITHGNATTFYDRNGHFTGSITRPSTSTNHPLTGGSK